MGQAALHTSVVFLVVFSVFCSRSAPNGGYTPQDSTEFTYKGIKRSSRHEMCNNHNALFPFTSDAKEIAIGERQIPIVLLQA